MVVYNRPRVILSAAASIDGKIATRTGDSNLSSVDDLARVHELRSMADAILVGKNTVLRDDPLLTVRHVQGANPIRVILDSNAEIPCDCQILKTAHDVPTIIVASKQASEANLAELAGFADVIVVGEHSVDVRFLLDILYSEENVKTLLVEGGGRVNWEFIRLGLFDEIIVTISPYLLGGTSSSSSSNNNNNQPRLVERFCD